MDPTTNQSQPTQQPLEKPVTPVTTPLMQPEAQPIPPFPEQPTMTQPTPPNVQANKKSVMLIMGIILLVVLFAVLSGILLLRQNATPPSVVPQAQISAPPTTMPLSPTPSSQEEADANNVIIEDPTVETQSLDQDASSL